MNDENIPYRSAVDSQIMETEPRRTGDDDNYDTLKQIFKDLKASLANLDAWHAFDLTQTDNLNLKQQVKAHQLAYEIVAPLLDAVESALVRVDNKYKER